MAQSARTKDASEHQPRDARSETAAQLTESASPRFAAPPLIPGLPIVYVGPDQNGTERPQKAMVLVVADADAGIVDLHIFNGAMVGGSQDASGTYIPEYVRRNVPHATSVHNEGWHYEGEFEADRPTAPPAHLDEPSAYQEGVSIYCTMSNWDAPPTSYNYQWRRNGSPLQGETRDRYDTVSADTGQTLDCVLTCTNMAGSTSVTSNGVLVEAPAGSRVGEHDAHLP